MNLDTWSSAFLTLFAIVNPIGLLPVFMDFVDGLDRRDRIRVFNGAVLTGFITLLLMTITGKWLLANVFHVDLVEFRIAGGLILTVIAIRYIVMGKKDGPDRQSSENYREHILEMSIVPMGVPILVGPGSIVTGILVMDTSGLIVTLTALIAVFIVCWIIFQFSHLIGKLMGRVGRLVIGRVLWIFIAAIGVHLLISGIEVKFGL